MSAFGGLLASFAGGCKGIGLEISKHLKVPFLEARENETLLGHRLKDLDIMQPLVPTRQFRFADGEILCTNDWPERLFKESNEQLTEEVWSREYWPDSFNNCDEALTKMPNGITGVYFHSHSMNLVLLTPTGEKVGIRSTCLMKSRAGLAEFLEALKRAVLS